MPSNYYTRDGRCQARSHRRYEKSSPGGGETITVKCANDRERWPCRQTHRRMPIERMAASSLRHFSGVKSETKSIQAFGMIRQDQGARVCDAKMCRPICYGCGARAEMSAGCLAADPIFVNAWQAIECKAKNHSPFIQVERTTLEAPHS